MPVINSDAVRKTIAGKLGRHIAAFNEGLYNPDMYTRMMREAEKQILDGKGAILDATFGHKPHRDRAARLAAKHKLPWLMIHCYASDEITKQRLDRRLSGGKDLSDGRWETTWRRKQQSSRSKSCPPILVSSWIQIRRPNSSSAQARGLCVHGSRKCE